MPHVSTFLPRTVVILEVKVKIIVRIIRKPIIRKKPR